MFSSAASLPTTATLGATLGKSLQSTSYILNLLLTQPHSILWVYVIFNIVAALAFYYLLRMPKPKKEKKNKKEVGAHAGAVKEQHLDQPSHVGSSLNSNTEQHAEKNTETARYASITGTTTPPQHATEISEKA